jgi:hypothetical protein
VPSHWHEGWSGRCSLKELRFHEAVLELCWESFAEALAGDVASERFEREGSSGCHCEFFCVNCLKREDDMVVVECDSGSS